MNLIAGLYPEQAYDICKYLTFMVCGFLLLFYLDTSNKNALLKMLFNKMRDKIRLSCYRENKNV